MGSEFFSVLLSLNLHSKSNTPSNIFTKLVSETHLITITQACVLRKEERQNVPRNVFDIEYIVSHGACSLNAQLMYDCEQEVQAFPPIHLFSTGSQVKHSFLCQPGLQVDFASFITSLAMMH